jgi:hypothetical protein
LVAFLAFSRRGNNNHKQTAKPTVSLLYSPSYVEKEPGLPDIAYQLLWKAGLEFDDNALKLVEPHHFDTEWGKLGTSIKILTGKDVLAANEAWEVLKDTLQGDKRNREKIPNTRLFEGIQTVLHNAIENKSSTGFAFYDKSSSLPNGIQIGFGKRMILPCSSGELSFAADHACFIFDHNLQPMHALAVVDFMHWTSMCKLSLVKSGEE